MENSRDSRSTDVVAAACAAAFSDRGVPCRGKTLVVGLSGGLDSVSLLHALHRLASPLGFNLTALHVHHGLSANADDWAAFCETLCRDLGRALKVERVVVERGSADGLEAAARRARHAAFARSEGDFIVLAHHCGDQAETLLFNLLRGTGLSGAAAMVPHRGRLLRPLLAVARSDIEAYARHHELRWIEDESNQDCRFSRNFLRHRILRPMSERFPATGRNFAAASARFAEAAALLDELADIDLNGHPRDFPIATSLLARLSEPRARNVLRYLLGRRGIRIPGESRLAEALRQMLAAAPDRHPRVRLGGWWLMRRQGNIELEPVT